MSPISIMHMVMIPTNMILKMLKIYPCNSMASRSMDIYKIIIKHQEISIMDIIMRPRTIMMIK